MRKIIHVDMDCFYAAIEIRDNPSLADKPVAVGGPAQRGVLCTSNYIARQYGVRSAMPVAVARRLCRDLIILPVNMPKYKQVAQRVHAIFRHYTPLVEPLALDEAYLDVTDVGHYEGSATRIAQAIRRQIFESEGLTASAGAAPNKFLAKIASGWKKPNGLFVIRPQDIDAFVKQLKVEELFGVGKVTAEKLHQLKINTCADLQLFTLQELTQQFGKLGRRLYEQCRGIDDRKVEANRLRKSLSVEQTFHKDLATIDEALPVIAQLQQKLLMRLQHSSAAQYPIKNQFVKIKFNDFTLTTAEIVSHRVDEKLFETLFYEAVEKCARPIRLLGLGVHFKNGAETCVHKQMTLLEA